MGYPQLCHILHIYIYTYMWSAGGTHHIFADPFGDVFARRRSWSADAMCRSFGHRCRRVSWRLIACLVFDVPTWQSTHFFKYMNSLTKDLGFCGTNTISNLFELNFTYLLDMSHEIQQFPIKRPYLLASTCTLHVPFFRCLEKGHNVSTESLDFSRCQETTQTLGLGCNGILTKDSGVFQLDFLRTGHCGEVVNPQIQKAADLWTSIIFCFCSDFSHVIESWSMVSDGKLDKNWDFMF